MAESTCKWCDEGNVAEKSPHTGTYIHRRHTLDKPCTNPRCPTCGDVVTFKDASGFYWCGNAHWWKGQPFKLPDTLMDGMVVCVRPTDLRNRIGQYMVEEKGLHIGDKVDAGKVQNMIEEFVTRELARHESANNVQAITGDLLAFAEAHHAAHSAPPQKKGNLMNYEAAQDKLNQYDWRVEAIDFDSGDVYVTIFAGPDAEQRAKEYAGWKNNGQ